MNGGKPMMHAKKTPAGPKKRMELLEGAGFTISGATGASRPQEVGRDDILDACAVCWTAERIARGLAVRVPAEPLCDAKGLRMEIWR